MSFRRINAVASSAALLLVLGGLPAATATTAGAAIPASTTPESPVTLISLTDSVGEPTKIAVQGIEEIAADAGTALGTGVGGTGIGGVAGASVPTFRAASADTTGDPAELDNVAVLTPPTATEEFLVAGLTWDADSPLAPGSQMFLRVQENGDWSDWLQIEEEESDRPTSVAGTGPFLTGGAEAVQVQVTGEAAALPANLQLSLIPANPTPAEEVITDPGEAPDQLPTEAPVAAAAPVAYRSLGTLTTSGAGTVQPASFTPAAAPAAAAVAAAAPAATAVAPAASPAVPTTLGGPAAAAARPAVISRAGWGADESFMKWRPSYKALKAAIVHHTAGTNNYTAAQSASIVRGIYYYHAVTNGWGDIGYNFLVDKYGQVFEGRSGSIPAPTGTMPQGAHAASTTLGNFNPGTLGISAMGDYTQVGAPQIILDRMADVIAWKFGEAGIDVNTPSGIMSPGTAARPKGQNLPRIFGHRDVGATTCPGNDIYGRLGSLTRAVDARLTHLFYLNNSFSGQADIVFDYGNPNDRFLVGDWDGDKIDTMAIRRSNVFYVRNSNTTGNADKVFAYGNPGDVVLVGDWDGDGVDTLAVRRGNLYYFKNSVSTGVADVVIAYGNPDDQVLVGDWDGDGKDTLAVRRGNNYFVKNSITTGVADKVIMYGNPGDITIVGDWDGDGVDTFGVRRGITYYLKNSISTGVADRVFAYGNPGDEVIVGDWDGNRTDTLGVIRR
ncbi:N-acetylmuramoyl-L-alanine amidase [Georgenia ruanii]|uniref:N-acetylmuramoyl-L-alanine amidase n=1 Tax=Georgenia ruanii TaxID=348442 RepID=UPI001264F663|nr:N-acetylmuramoyl-L-alanine amidase [Georgenia ruanii]